jgi:anti-sigma factor RsiW
MRELLPELLHDSLTDAERAQVEGHLATCEDCAAELALLRSARRTMSAVRVPALDTAAIVAALPRPSARRPDSRSTVRTEVRRTSNFFRIAAAVTFVSLGGMSVAIARSYFGTSPTAMVDTALSGESAQQAALQAAPPLASADTPVTRTGTSRGMSVHTALGDLNDAELESLLSELDQLEAAPLAEPESTPGGRVVGNAPVGS